MNYVHCVQTGQYLAVIGYVQTSCNELARLVTRHTGCLVDALNTIISTCSLIKVAQGPLRSPPHQGRIVLLCTKHCKTPWHLHMPSSHSIGLFSHDLVATSVTSCICVLYILCYNAHPHMCVYMDYQHHGDVLLLPVRSTDLFHQSYMCGIILDVDLHPVCRILSAS